MNDPIQKLTAGVAKLADAGLLIFGIAAVALSAFILWMA